MIIFKHTIKNCRLKSSIIKSYDRITIEFIGHAHNMLNKNFDERVAYITRFTFLIIDIQVMKLFLNNIEKYVDENFGVKNIEFIFQTIVNCDFIEKRRKNLDNDFTII